MAQLDKDPWWNHYRLHILLPLGLASYSLLYWSLEINKAVQDPYLDEVFHVPQAQVYWSGSWRTWDPKITTPPGLYLYSYMFSKIYSLFVDVLIPSVSLLRYTNQMLLVLIPGRFLRDHPKDQNVESLSVLDILHRSLNVVLFPLLFFFSALYYTDVLSAVVVNEAYCWFTYQQSDVGVKNQRSASFTSVLRKYIFFPLGLFAMLVRQTNVFWVAVFLGGLQVVKTLRKPENAASPKSSPNSDELEFYDPPLQGAAIEDYGKTVVGLAFAALNRISQLINDLLPYLALLAAFAVFVLWNGGVVLGDKENHVASVHLPQMLYIWPCMVFFSWPVLLPTAARISRRKLPRLSVAVVGMGLMLTIVHFNTIVHPFTLADNRHYVFYVFRILLRYRFLKYAAVPVYFVCGWLVVAALGEMPGKADPKAHHMIKKKAKQVGRPPKESPKPQESIRVSFVIVWLAATTLSLVTAPLVEPRYFIVPWLIWRASVPVEQYQEFFEGREGKVGGVAQRALNWAASNRLWMETLWYLLINLVTCYMFLYKGFEWPQEPGKVQRFMW